MVVQGSDLTQPIINLHSPTRQNNNVNGPANAWTQGSPFRKGKDKKDDYSIATPLDDNKRLKHISPSPVGHQKTTQAAVVRQITKQVPTRASSRLQNNNKFSLLRRGKKKW